MYGNGLQMNGMYSGWDTQSIIEKLMKNESTRLEKTIENIEKMQWQQKVWGEAKEKLNSFRNLANDFRYMKNFSPNTASSANESILSVSADANATVQDFYVKVVQQSSSTSLTATNDLKIAEDIYDGNTTLGEISQDRSAGVFIIDGDYGFTLKDKNGDIFNLTITTASDDTIDDLISKLNGTGDFTLTDDEGNAVADASAKLSELIESVNYNDGKLKIIGGENLSNITINTEARETDLDALFSIGKAELRSIEGETKIVMESIEKIFSESLKNISGSSTWENEHITINGQKISISETDTVNSLIDKINSNKNANVYASIDNDGKFLIENKAAGPEVLAVTGSLESLKVLGLRNEDDSYSYSLDPGEKAQIQISGNASTVLTTLESWDNTFTYKGVSIEALTTSSDFIKIEVKKDSDAILENVKNFVNEYNELMEYLTEKYTEKDYTGKENREDFSDEEKMQGVMRGDKNLKNIIDKLKSIAYTPVKNANMDYSSLVEVGITSGDTYGDYSRAMKGLLSVDEDKLLKVIEENPKGLWDLFSLNDTANNKFGFATSFRNYSYDLVKFGGTIGKIADPNGSLATQMRRETDSMANQLRLLESKEASYIKQFTAMEKALAEMNSQQNYLYNAFSN
jgi:flagellar hook-associated protein 2